MKLDLAALTLEYLDTAALLRAGGRVIRVIMHMQKRVKIPDAETKRKQW